MGLFKALNGWAQFAIIAMVLSTAGTVFWWIRSTGYDAAINEVDKQDDEAFNAAELAALGLGDCNAARLDGKRVRWDFKSSECVRSEQSGQSE